ncbi:hypothetical protein PF004_g19276 [Phytophthora fragariae]|uniref:Tc1-like transposase DDE domain-containing protein n=2 Tax=Phytophthora fragariae TaxID=53985 RepID=A0A6G0NAN7_9STRA|nr:hypothetical protein PF004_g19276 [Phytophthora fragariae]
MLVLDDYNVDLSLSTISRHLLGMLYTVKQTRIEPSACNSEVNKQKRKEFAEVLIAHHAEGNRVVYFDETNFNLYTNRKKGKRPIDVLPTSKGPNLQIQCAVSSAIGVVKYHTQRGSIKMHENAAFVDEIYDAVKATDVYKDSYADKKIVVVFDNAPAHSQTEVLVPEREDLVLLRLGPYSPMCNPIENCFSLLKGHIKDY